MLRVIDKNIIELSLDGNKEKCAITRMPHTKRFGTYMMFVGLASHDHHYGIDVPQVAARLFSTLLRYEETRRWVVRHGIGVRWCRNPAGIKLYARYPNPGNVFDDIQTELGALHEPLLGTGGAAHF